MTRRWPPEDFDVASVSARNRRAWAEQEAKRVSQIGKYANGVTDSMSGGVEGHAGTRVKLHEASPTRGCASAGTAGVESGPLTHQRAADAVASVRVTTDAAAQGLRLPLDEAIAISQYYQRSGPQPSPSAPLRDAVSAAPIPCLVGKTTKRNLAGVSSGHSSKYRNKPTNGYASIREAKRAFQLKLMQEAGQIRNLREQVPYLLIPKQDGERACSYVADFVYEEFRGDPQSLLWGTVVEDCKGMRTDVYRIKKKLLLFVHGIRIRET